MKRLLIPFVAAFGLSLGVATGVVMVRTPKAPKVPVIAAKTAPAKPAQAKPDSASGTEVATNPQSQAAPGVDRGATLAPASASAAVPTSPVATLASAQIPQSASTVGSAMAKPQSSIAHAIAPGIVPAAEPDTIVGKKLAKVFGAMQARDAARVLEQMDDGDVRTILASLSNKQQAAILGTFPTQRAATIMRATLRNSGSDQ